jgi:hypothetical protein
MNIRVEQAMATCAWLARNYTNTLKVAVYVKSYSTALSSIKCILYRALIIFLLLYDWRKKQLQKTVSQ